MGLTRIIAGEARGRKITVPPSGTRPTSDRAREGLFSSLQVRFGFSGQVVLDLFAGSGALGLEAASRGAEEIVFVDNQTIACDTIRTNIAVVRHRNCTVHNMKASTFLAGAPDHYFSMVLADPPYDLSDDAVASMVRALVPKLKNGAVVVVERHRDSPETCWPSCLVPTGQKLKKRLYGIARMDMAVFDEELLNEEATAYDAAVAADSDSETK